MEQMNEAIYYLPEMYRDEFYPTFLVDRVREEIEAVVEALEEGEREPFIIQKMFDRMTTEINHLQEDFISHKSALELFAQESILRTVEQILAHYHLPLKLEEALRLWRREEPLTF